MAPNTHTVEDFRVSIYSEIMQKTLKRLEAPGSLEVRWGGGVGMSMIGAVEQAEGGWGVRINMEYKK